MEGLGLNADDRSARTFWKIEDVVGRAVDAAWFATLAPWPEPQVSNSHGVCSHVADRLSDCRDQLELNDRPKQCGV